MKLITLFLTLITNTAWSLTGLEVMEKVRKQSKGFIGSTSSMKMTLIDANNKSVERLMTSFILEGKDGNGDKSITEFQKPLDVKGTKLLTWTIKESTNKQWLYLPRFKRIKKINSKNQAGSFMGSEFSYEDIAGQELSKYNHKLLSENNKQWLIESKPKTASGYTKLINRVSKDLMTTTEVKYFDRRGQLLKKSTILKHKEYLVGKKKILFSNKIIMDNLQTKKRSIIEWLDRNIGLNHPSKLFKSSRLK